MGRRLFDGRVRGGIWLAILLGPIWAAAATGEEGGIDLGAGVVAHVVEGRGAGPVVLVVGGIHGNEPAGSAAAKQIRHWPLERGRLVVVPRANVAALERGSRRTPGEVEDRADLNRNFPRAGRDEPARGHLARVLWELAERERPDWLLDLHEGRALRAAGVGSVGNTIISLREERCVEVAGMLVEAVNDGLGGREAFVVLRGPVDGSVARAVGEHLGGRALIVETTRAGQPLARRARQHRVVVLALLRELGMVGGEVSAEVAGAGHVAPAEAGVPWRVASPGVGSGGGVSWGSAPGRAANGVALGGLVGGWGRRDPGAADRLLWLAREDRLWARWGASSRAGERGD